MKLSWLGGKLLFYHKALMVAVIFKGFWLPAINHNSRPRVNPIKAHY